MNGQRSVLIVDRTGETREVLATALERRGVRTLWAGKARTGAELARKNRPDLVVLDLDRDELPPNEFSDQPRIVLLGSMRRGGKSMPGVEFIAKPYHFAPLIHKIEELLAAG